VPLGGAFECGIPVTGSPFVIGRRREGAGLVLGSPAVGKAHARLEAGAGGGWAVRDLRSLNGTFVNGARVPPGGALPVVGGDVLTLADVSVRFLD
jgi:pSer/pThr/pTyr-binding forkhead associated (FHA) protein